jgi:peptidyl-prolyl cis-trans isomerase SurA
MTVARPSGSLPSASPVRVLFAVGMLGVMGFFGLTGCQATERAASSDAQDTTATPVVLARYGDRAITQDEFEWRYARSVGGWNEAADDSMAAYRDFLDRYLDFRLKVRAARAARMDRDSTLQAEIRRYRQQMARPQLVEDRVLDPILRTLYERQQTEVDVSHILLRLPEGAPPSDTLRAYRRLQAIRDSLQRGAASFAAMARRHSDGPSAEQGGRLGYLTAGRTVQAFEDAMYATPTDSLSSIVRTRFGYHLLTVHDRRPARQPVKVAHIMIQPDSTQDAAAARQLATRLRDSLAQGADFGELARQYSDDAQSARRGGTLGGFIASTDQRLPGAFKEAAFRLDSLGAVSDVVETRFGYHLIKLTDRKNRPTFAEARSDLVEQARQLPRFEAAKTDLARRLRQRFRAQLDTTRLLRTLGVPADTSGRALIDAALPDTAQAAPVAAVGDSSYTMGALQQFARQTDQGAQESLLDLADRFLNDAALDYGAATLEERDTGFRRLMTEYREGLLLFAYMQDSVWTAAAQDTAGLRAHFQAHRDQYRFPPRVRTLAARASADSLLRPLVAALEQGAAPARVQALVDTLATVRLDTVMVTDSTTAPYGRVRDLADGAYAGPLSHENRSLLLVRDERLAARRKTFAEARSAVVQDYQTVLERRITERLRQRYDAELYPERLSSVFGGDGRPDGLPDAPAPAATPGGAAQGPASSSSN